jgi:hypothetical protein
MEETVAFTGSTSISSKRRIWPRICYYIASLFASSASE